MSSLGIKKPFAALNIGKRGMTALVLLAAIGWWAGSASAAVLNVGSCVKGTTYPTINAAVSAAIKGDTISVCPGDYYEIVTINKNLSIVGKQLPSGGVATLRFPDVNQCAGLPYSHDCPQIVVQGATASIQHLTIDGSAFNYDCYYTPIGVLFYNASGSAQFNNIINQDATCECEMDLQNQLENVNYKPSGIAVWSDANPKGAYSVLVQGNYIDNFGALGVYGDGVTTNVTNNSIGVDTEHTTAIYFGGAPGSSALNNTIWGSGATYYQTGIGTDYSSNVSLTRNTITDIHTAIDIDHGGNSTLNANTMKYVIGGMRLTCSSGNKLISNSVYDRPSDDGVYGVNLYACDVDPGSDNNLLNGNKFNGLCGGILEGSADNTGNTFINNTFSNIGPGSNIMPGNDCPAF